MCGEGDAGNWKVGEAGVMRKAQGGDLGPALLHGSRSLQKIKKMAWSESRDTGTGTGQEIALTTASGVAWCGMSGPTAPVFGVTGSLLPGERHHLELDKATSLPCVICPFGQW